MPRNYFILLLQFAILLFNLLRLIDVSLFVDDNTILTSIVLTFCSVFLFLFFRESNPTIKKQLLRISYLFILGYIIVNFQFYLDFLLGNTQNFRGNYFIYNYVVSKSSIISSIGLNAFFIGYLLKTSSKIRIKPSKKIFRMSEWFLVVSVLLSFGIFYLTADKRYFSGQYGMVELGVVPTFAQTFLYYFVSAYIISLAYKFKKNNEKLSIKKYIFKFNIIFLAVIVIYLLLVLVSGDRGPIMQIGLLFIAGYLFSQNKKIPAKYFILGIVLGAFVITTLGQVRSFKDETSFIERYNKSKEESKKFENYYSISPSTHELAISVRTNHAALDFVEKKGYKYGMVQLNQLSAIVPGFGTFIRLATGLETKDLASADILTYHILGPNPSHGLGTSALADIYLDFGTLGIIIGFILFGVFVRVLEVSSYSEIVPRLLLWVMAFVFLSKALYIGRSSIVILFRECFTIYFIILFSSFINRKHA